MTRTAVITGAVGGLGAEVASILGGQGWSLVLIVRSEAKAAQLLHRLRAERLSLAIEVVEADLADQDEVVAAAAKITMRHPRIEALFNIAGVLLGDLRTSRHGNELHFQVNTLAPYMLIRLLRQPLVASGQGVVVSASAGAIAITGRLKVQQLRAPPKLRKLIGPYAQSKLALTTLTNALAPEYGEAGTVLRTVDPGPNRTDMTAGAGMPSLLLWLRPLIFRPATRGGQKIVDAAFDPKFGRATGLYIEGGKTRRPPRDASDDAVQARLIALCRELTGI